MKKSEIFEEILNKACEICEVRVENVLRGSKLQSVVDARILSVQYMRRTGLSSDDIALIVLRRTTDEEYPSIETIKKKAKSIDRMFNSYSQRCSESYAFCLLSVDIQKYCHSRYKEFYAEWMKALPQR